VFRIRRTIINELRMDKRFVLWRLALVLGAQFLIHPITETVAAVTPEYDRLKVHGEAFIVAGRCTRAIVRGLLHHAAWRSASPLRYGTGIARSCSTRQRLQLCLCCVQSPSSTASWLHA